MKLEVALGAETEVAVSLSLPADARAAEPTPVDLSVAPGAELGLARAWQLAGGARAELVCVHAPPTRWAPGLERAVLDGATAVARRLAGFATTVPGPVSEADAVVTQPFELAAPGRHALGRHALGFAAPHRTVVLCTVACTERDGGGPCAPLAESLVLSGSLGPPPEGSLVTRALLWSATHPWPALGGLGLLTLLLAGLVLWRRPRPRP
ncbi:MAG: hypothetical protein IT373_02270 [Polyangiaceae bacterium]|nr:hypothetical protein [Polyangiaceae bacterium]